MQLILFTFPNNVALIQLSLIIPPLDQNYPKSWTKLIPERNLNFLFYIPSFIQNIFTTISHYTFSLFTQIVNLSTSLTIRIEIERLEIK